MTETPQNASVAGWESAERLPLLHGRRFLTLCKHVCPPNDILAVLIQSRSGEVELVLVPGGRGLHELVNSTRAVMQKLKMKVSELSRHAFELGTTPRLASRGAEFKWQLFVKDYRKRKGDFLAALSLILNRDLSADLLERVSRELADTPRPP